MCALHPMVLCHSFPDCIHCQAFQYLIGAPGTLCRASFQLEMRPLPNCILTGVRDVMQGPGQQPNAFPAAAGDNPVPPPPQPGQPPANQNIPQQNPPPVRQQLRPAAAAGAATPAPGRPRGLVQELQALVIGFFTSLLPGSRIHPDVHSSQQLRN